MKNIIRARLWIFLPLVFISGCVTYKEPTEGPIAHIRFIAMGHGGIVRTFDFDSNNCQQNFTTVAVLGGIRTDGRKRIGLPLSEGLDENYFSEVSIPASKPFPFQMSHGESAGYVGVVCRVNMQLTATPNSIYEAQFEWKSPYCSINVREIKRNLAGAYEKIPTNNVRPLPSCQRK